MVGATGGVGVFAMQLGRHLGAKVTAVARREADRLRQLGAEYVFVPGSDEKLPSDERFDVLLDCSGKLSFSEAAPFLGEKGRYLTAHHHLEHGHPTGAVLLEMVAAA